MGERLLGFYQAVLAAFWAPITALFFFLFPDPGIEETDTPAQREERIRRARLVGIIRRVGIITLGLVLLIIGFALKTGGVACAEWFGLTNLGRVVIVAGGIASFLVTPVVALAAAVLILWIVIAIGLVQIPIGEGMEVLRELGQMLRVQDPVVRTGEGNIRLINVQRVLRWSMLLLLIPAMDLMSTVWLAVFPSWYVYAMLLLISGGGLAYGLIAAARGRRVGAGLDLLIGMNGYLVVGGIITLLTKLYTSLMIPGLLHLALVYVIAFVLHVVAIVTIVRILRRPPEGEQNGTASASVGAALGTVGRGDSGFMFQMNAWLGWGLVLAVLAAIVWLVKTFWQSEWTCRFGDTIFWLCLTMAVIGFAVGLLRQFWSRSVIPSALGGFAVCVALFGYTYGVLDGWNDAHSRTCRSAYADQQQSTPHATPASAAPAATAPEPPRTAAASVGAPAEDGRIASYFAENGQSCPHATTLRGWQSLRDARAACTSEAWLARNGDYRH